jgi:hypothetical protein
LEVMKNRDVMRKLGSVSWSSNVWKRVALQLWLTRAAKAVLSCWPQSLTDTISSYSVRFGYVQHSEHAHSLKRATRV